MEKLGRISEPSGLFAEPVAMVGSSLRSRIVMQWGRPPFQAVLPLSRFFFEGPTFWPVLLLAWF